MEYPTSAMPKGIHNHECAGHPSTRSRHTHSRLHPSPLTKSLVNLGFV
jgi:hypothetical protein